MMKRQPKRLVAIVLYGLLMLSLQSCFGIGNSDFTSATNGQNGAIGVNQTEQAAFKGKIYFTIDHNLYVLDSQKNLTQITKYPSTEEVYDPAVSPDGKWIAYIIRYKLYSDLVYRSTDLKDTTIHTVVTGTGSYTLNGEGANTYNWFAQPSWTPDSQSLIFLSDLQKAYYWKNLGGVFADSYFLDLQVFELPIGQAELNATEAVQSAKAIAYAAYGDGGNRDPSFRPKHDNEVVYTHYQYDASGTKQEVQLDLEDVNMMDPTKYTAAYSYHPGFDPSLSLTPAQENLVNMEPSFSPDGNTLIYVRRQDATHMSLYTMPVSNIIDDNANNANFDPNAQATENSALQPYNKSTSLLTDQYLSDPVWSPDGTQIIYYDYSDTTFNLSLATVVKDTKTGIYSIKAGSQIVLVNSQGDISTDSRPAWSAS